MYIISKKKDYYDHVSQIYGIDKKIIYNRNRLTDEIIDGDFRYYPDLKVKFKNKLSLPNNRYYIKSDIYIKNLVILGKTYPLINNKLIADYSDDELELKLKISKWNNPTKQYKKYFSKYNQDIFNLCKIIKSPVFIINNFSLDEVSIENKIPNLGELGIPKYYDAYQLYQDIEYFLGNIVNDSPDINPPVKIDNKIKIVQAGFDIKKSFRHRI